MAGPPADGLDGDTVIRTESQGHILVGVAVGFAVASAVIMSLRLYTRLVLLRITGIDDWTMLVAMMISIVLSVSTGMEAKYGMGKHVEAVSAEETAEQLKYLYVNILFYNLGMNVVKISFLFQYRRIFQDRHMQRICFWVMLYVAAWTCTQATLLGVACLPISFIVPSTASWCLDTLPIWYFSSAMSLATDLLIFSLPLPSVLKLQLPTRQKIMVFGIFCLGFFVCIISTYRITTLRGAVESQDPPWDNVGAAVWSVVELNTAIICSSLPTLRPLLSKYVPGLSSMARSRSDQYHRYGSRSTIGSHHPNAATFPGRKSSSPRSISTEELGLADVLPGQANPQVAAYTYCSADAERDATRRQEERDRQRRILVTTETSVRY